MVGKEDQGALPFPTVMRNGRANAFPAFPSLALSFRHFSPCFHIGYGERSLFEGFMKRQFSSPLLLGPIYATINMSSTSFPPGEGPYGSLPAFGQSLFPIWMPVNASPFFLRRKPQDFFFPSFFPEVLSFVKG